jgi:hypothetical protein
VTSFTTSPKIWCALIELLKKSLGLSDADDGPTARGRHPAKAVGQVTQFKRGKRLWSWWDHLSEPRKQEGVEASIDCSPNRSSPEPTTRWVINTALLCPRIVPTQRPNTDFLADSVRGLAGKDCATLALRHNRGVPPLNPCFRDSLVSTVCRWNGHAAPPATHFLAVA